MGPSVGPRGGEGRSPLSGAPPPRRVAASSGSVAIAAQAGEPPCIGLEHGPRVSAWLAEVHGALDAAVAAAYSWEAEWRDGMTDDAILARLFALNQARAAREAADAKPSRRAAAR